MKLAAVFRAAMGALALVAVFSAVALVGAPRRAHAQFANPSNWYVGWATAPSTAAPLASLLSPALNLASFQNGVVCYAAAANTGTVALGSSSSVTTTTGVPLTPAYVSALTLGVNSLGSIWVVGNGSDKIFCYGN
jgi:hypothetical protein